MPLPFRERFSNRVRRRFAERGGGRRLCLAIACVAACCVTGAASAADYYAAPCGGPDGRGTAEAPWDIESVFAGRQPVEPGSTVYLEGGVYRHPNRTRDGGAYRFSMKGEEGNPIHVRPVPGERATIDAGLTVEGAADVWMWDLEFTVSEAQGWDRRVEQAGSHIEDDKRPAGGITVNSARRCKFINLVVHDNPSTGVSFWRTAIDCELHGCLIFRNGWIGPDRYHGPGIYTQNDDGEKRITDCIFWGNYSTTIQAYGSARAFVNNFRIIGNIAFAPLREGSRQRILIGGGRPSRGIVAAENILYEVPLQIGYTAPHNEDCVVRDNVIVSAGMSINRFRQVDEQNNTVLPANAPRPEEPARMILRPNRYDPNRANLAVFNWRKADAVPVGLGGFLDRGDRFRIVSVLDFFGSSVAEGTFDGEPVDVPIPAHADTGGGEFCAFVLFRMPVADVVARWEEAGAAFGWSTIGSDGEWRFHRERPEAGGLPAFRFTRFPAGKVKSLPTPDFPFGLWLGWSGRDADLEEAATHQQLQAIRIEGNYAYGVTDAGLQALAALPRLQALCLPYTAHTDAGMKELAALEQLRTLTLGQTGDDGLKELAALEHLEALHIISTSVTDAGMQALPRLKALRTLTILSSGGAVSDAGLNELGKMTQLQSLSLRHTKLKVQHLKAIGGLKRLRTLDLYWTDTTNAGLKALTGLTELRSLDIGWNYQISDDGLQAIAGLKQLQSLRLNKTNVTDAGMKALGGLEHLRTLNLSDTKVTDAGLAELAGLKQLETLTVSCHITDVGLKWLAGHTQLRRLELTFSGVTDAGLQELAGLDQLQSLRLFCTKVSDAGMKHLAGLRRLESLDLYGTAVSGTGLKELANLEHLQEIELKGAPVTDAGLASLAGLRELRTLGLYETQVTGTGLKHLAGLKKLQSLDLSRAPVTHLDGLAALEQLRSLQLDGAQVTDAELKALSALSQLEELDLRGNPVTDAGLEALTALSRLRSLRLDRTSVSDAGLKVLARFKRLQSLHLPGRVTDAAIAELHEALPAAIITASRPPYIM